MKDHRWGWPELLVVVLAALTRFWRLGYHSIWFDEAVSLEWAMADPAWTWDKTILLVEEKHPPVYYLFLHYWQEALNWAGLSYNDAALRASGALLGVLTVVGLLLLVRRVASRATALAAALLTALAPVLVWYSQELRMFQPATTALVWGGYFLVRAWNGETILRRTFWWLAMAAAFLAALYSYLFSALLLPAAGLSLLLLWAADKRDRAANLRVLEGAAAFALVAALFLPLAQNAWGVNSSEGTPATAFAHVGETLLRQLRVFSIWRPGWPAWLEWAAVGLMGALVALGLFLPGGRRSPVEQGWLLLWVGVPLLLGNLLLVTSDSIFGEDRYFLFLGPFLLWAAARGVVLLAERQRVVAWGAGGVLAVALAAALPVLWTPALLREQWRAAAELITQQAAANPALRTAAISHVDYTHMPLEWYVRQKYDFDALPIYFPFGGRLDPSQVETVIAPPLAGVANEGFDTLWLTQSHLEGVDETRLVEGWLNAHYPLISEAFPAGIRLTGYATRTLYDVLPSLPEGSTRPDMELAPGVTLAACEVTTPTLRATDDSLQPPGRRAHVRLWWQATDAPRQDYTARVQVMDMNGKWGEEIQRPGDALRLFPSQDWPAGEYVRHEVDVNLNPVTPPGEYAVRVRLLDGAGAELPAVAECGTVQIIP